MNAQSTPRRIVHRIKVTFTVLGLCLVFGLSTLFAYLWFEHRSELTLPTPTGPFAIGRAIYDWADDKTADPFAPVPNTRRELLVWMWYPATTAQSAPEGDYVSGSLRSAIARQSGVLLSKFLTRDLSKVRTHSRPSANVSSQQQSFPIILMRAGASLEVASYSTLAEDLASHGYVVVGIDAPFRTGIVAFPDGRVVTRPPQNDPEACLNKAGQERERCAERFLTAWNSDLAYVLDRLVQLNASDPSGRFTGRLDLTRVGVFGHSFGGAQAAEFCSLDTRCKAAIDLDGAPHGSVIQTGIHCPFMFLLSDHSREFDPESRQIKSDIRSVYDHTPANERLLVTIRGANHFTFSDDGAMLKSRLLRGVLRGLGKLGMDGDRQLAVTAYCLHTFFDVYLHSPSVEPPQIASSLYPEIEVLN